jgi:uncharacterized membrane protein SirB2
MMAGSPKLQARPARVLPHVVDTLLLVSAIALAWQSSQYPFVQGWLTAKLLALIAYIGLGVMALKRGRTPAIRAKFFVAALLVFGYIVAVAVTKTPLPGF